MIAPAIVGGFLIMLPLLDKGPDRAPRTRRLWLGALTGILAAIGALTVMSFMRDSGNPELGKRREAAMQLADRARTTSR